MNPNTASIEEVCQAILFMDARQTEDERVAHSTRWKNKAGWNGRDAAFGSSLAKQIRAGRNLTIKQEEAARRMLRTYSKSQLADFKASPKSTRRRRQTTRATTLPVRRAELTEHAEEILIRFPYDPKLVEKVKTIPGRRWDKERKAWAIPYEKGIADKVIDFLGDDLKHNPQMVELKASLDEARAKNEVAAKAPLPVAIAEAAYPFQQDGIRHLVKQDCRCLLGDEMGLGKTIQAIGAVEQVEALPAIVVCPASLKLNWARELKRWTGKHAVIINGRPNGQKASVKKDGWVIINYDILNDWAPRLTKVKAPSLILDECHYIKNQKAKRTKAAQRLAKSCKNIIALSGTPITNRPVEFFTTLNLIDGVNYKSFWKFAQRYCGARHNRFGWDFSGASHTDELHTSLVGSGLMLRRLKADVLKELPPKVRVVVPVEGASAMMENYRIAERNFLGWLGEVDPEKLEAAQRAEALTRMEALKQLAVKAKLFEALGWIQDTLDATGGKLVVFATHKATLDALEADYPGETVRVDGSTPLKARQEAVDQFQKNPKVRLFIGNIKAAGVGITLTAANATCFLELGWTPGEHDQAEDRIHRIGQEADSVTAYYILLADSVEEEIAALLDKKRQVLASVLDGKDIQDESLLVELLDNLKQKEDGR